jgi:cyclophilin family peptidyl-prolyl cis-trans isomerase
MKPALLMTLLAATLVAVACATAAPTPTRTPTRPPATPTPRAITPPATRAPAVTTTPGTPAPTATPKAVQGPLGNTYKQWASAPPMTINTASKYTATLRTNKGNIAIELFAAEAPRTVNNFVFLAREGYYDGVIFHRVIKGFMIQSGDPKGDGAGGPGYRFADEQPVTRKYTKGIVAMANAGPNTNGSQFFIVHGADAGLPPSYTIFGQVVSGLETVDLLANTPVQAVRGTEVSSPTERLVIEKVEITETPAP